MFDMFPNTPRRDCRCNYATEKGKEKEMLTRIFPRDKRQQNLAADCISHANAVWSWSGGSQQSGRFDLGKIG
jgi:hypothetical protein